MLIAISAKKNYLDTKMVRRIPRSHTTLELWEYFDKISDTIAKCLLCGGIKQSSNTIGNLKKHLRCKHNAVYLKLCKAEERVKLLKNNHRNLREQDKYRANSSTTSSDDETLTKNYIIYTRAGSKASWTDPLHFQNSPMFLRQAKGKSKKKRLIEKLAEEKNCVANLKKQLLDKEMEEHNLKVLILQKETIHKIELSKLEKEEIDYGREEIEHNEQIKELLKQEMLVTLEILRKKELKKIKEPKINDVKKLLKYIPEEKRKFYDDLIREQEALREAQNGKENSEDDIE